MAKLERRSMLIGLVILSAVLVLAVAACSDDDEPSNGNGDIDPTREATATERLADPTAIEELAEPTEATESDDSIQAQAESLCPRVDEDFFAGCVNGVVSQAESSRVGVLCVNSLDGRWYIATPGATPDAAIGQIVAEGQSFGDDCREPGHIVVALVGDGEIVR